MNQAQVVFTPSGKRGVFALGTPVLDAARYLGVDLDSVCGGRGLCGRCQVDCQQGEFSKHKIRSGLDHLGEPTRVEARYQRIHGGFVEARRLGCQATIQGDLVIDVPPESQVHRQVIRKAADTVDIHVDPAIKLYMVQVREPDMHDPSGDLERLFEALRDEWELTGLRADVGLLQVLQAVLRRGQWQITVAVHEDGRIIALWPGLKTHAYGVAVDVGSTTIAAHLCELSTGSVLASGGAMNPQIRFGEDLMSRVSYLMMNPGGEANMTRVVREAINQLLIDVTEEAEVALDDVLELTFVANPVMHHLLLGINPVELGGAPFALATDEAVRLHAASIGIAAHPRAQAYVLPCIAGHVGADTAGVILYEQPSAREEWSLLVDVGTNAEIVIGSRTRTVACSSPTGPAFEGAQISGGQRAAPGAIERVRIDRDTLEPRFSVIGSELWSSDENFATATVGIGVTGICGSGIIEVVAEMFLAGIIDADGTIRGELATLSPRIVADGRTFAYLLHDEGSLDRAIHDGANSRSPTIRITQNDVRQIQLAKAALYAGVKLLMDRLGIDHVDRIRLAGAFGSHIDVTYAMAIGLIPDCALENVSSAGNAAGNGARIALLDRTARTRIEQIVRGVEKVETAVEPAFQQHFVNAMAFPHKLDSFTELGKKITLPVPRLAADSRAERGARRSRRQVRKAG